MPHAMLDHADPARAQDPITDPARLAALHRARLLDTPVEEEFERITALATSMLRAPIALVSLVDEDRQFFKSARGLAEPWQAARQTGLDMSVCQHVVREGAPVAIPDVREDRRVQATPKVADAGMLAYAGAPLTLADGHTLGTLCVVDTEPRDWQPGEIALLTELAATAVAAIERRAAEPGPAPARGTGMPPDAVLAAADAVWQAADELLLALAGLEVLADHRDGDGDDDRTADRLARERIASAERALLDAADAFGRGAAAALHGLPAGLGAAARALWLGALYHAERVTVRRAAETRFLGGASDGEALQRATVLVRTAEAELERTATAYRRARLERRARASSVAAGGATRDAR